MSNQKHKGRVDGYQNTIFKFKRKLMQAKNEGKLYPLIGDDEIAVSQTLADRIRELPDLPDHLRDRVTHIHHGFVKFVYMM